MKRFDPKNIAILLLLGLFLWLAADRSALAGQDGGGGDHDRGLIAVTGSYGSGASALYLVDTKTRHLAVYRLQNGRELEFVAARDCSHDFYLESYNDQSSPAVNPAVLRRNWQEYNRRAEAGSTVTPKGVETPAESTGPSVPPRTGTGR